MALLHTTLFVVCLCAISSSERISRKRKSLSLTPQNDEPKLQFSSEYPSALVSLKETRDISSYFHDSVSAIRDVFQRGFQRDQKDGRTNAEENNSAIDSSRILSVLAHTGIVILALLAFLLVLLCLTPCWLGPAIKAAIAGLDKTLLGVDILVESISVNTFSGRVHIRGFKVCNPTGYQAQYMIEMETLLLDLKMHTLLYTVMKAMFSKVPIHVVISHFVFVKFQATVEKHSMHTSNVKQILDHVMEATKKKETPAEGSSAPQSAQTAKSCFTKNKNKKPKPQVTLQEIKIQDIDVRFQVESTVFGKHLESGCDITIADVNYPDFAKVHGSLMLDDIALFVLQTMLKMIITNIAGKKVGNEWF